MAPGPVRPSRLASLGVAVADHPPSAARRSGGQRSREERSRLLKRYKTAAKAAGIRDVRFHDLRHTFGTRMAAAGVPMRTLQEWMGHRD